jgi:hypothetical protein
MALLLLRKKHEKGRVYPENMKKIMVKTRHFGVTTPTHISP